MASSPITAWEIEGEKVKVVTDFLFLVSKISADGDCRHEIRRRLLLGRKAVTNLDCVEKSRHHSANKCLYNQGYGRLSGQIWLWELDLKEGQRVDAFERWCWRRLLKVLDSKDIIPVNLKGYQPWIFTGKTDAEALVFWSSDANRQLIGKVSDTGKD